MSNEFLETLSKLIDAFKELSEDSEPLNDTEKATLDELLLFAENYYIDSTD